MGNIFYLFTKGVLPMKDDKRDELIETERDPRNMETGVQFLDKLLNAVFLRHGNVVNEQKRSNSGNLSHSLRFLLIALVFAALVVGFYFALPHLGRWLEALLKHI